MDQLTNCADPRLLDGCIYCGGLEATRDHVPSRVFLDDPFPTNLPIVAACLDCNNGFARDEEYVACLIESAIAGSTDPERIKRAKVAQILRRSDGLRRLVQSQMRTEGGRLILDADKARLSNVVLKLARGHAAFELSLALCQDPDSIGWWPLAVMTDDERDAFDASHVTQLLGEVGSRGTQRLMVTQLTLMAPTGQLSTVGLLLNNWIDVQDGRYRYQAIDDAGGTRIKIVISEYLVAEIHWARAV